MKGAIIWVSLTIIISIVMFSYLSNLKYQKIYEEKNAYCINLSNQINEIAKNNESHLYTHCDCFFQNVVDDELLNNGVQPGCICNCLLKNGTMASVYIGKTS